MIENSYLKASPRVALAERGQKEKGFVLTSVSDIDRVSMKCFLKRSL